MKKPMPSIERIIAAFGIAVIADLIQFPLTAATATGLLAVPAEFADIVLDFMVMGATTALLGFHWVLLPTLFTEIIPGLDLIPTWTAAVAFVVWKRKKAAAQLPLHRPVIDVENIRNITPPPIARPVLPPPIDAARPQLTGNVPLPIESPVERRLKHLENLRDKQLLSQIEYESKRQQILNEI